MNKKLKILAIVLVALLIVAFVGYEYVMTAGARNLASEETTFKTSSKLIKAEFNDNSNLSNKKYLNQAIEITGLVTESTPKQIILDENIVCEMTENNIVVSKGKTTTIKGRFVGFDDLLSELKLDKSSIIKQ